MFTAIELDLFLNVFQILHLFDILCNYQFDLDHIYHILKTCTLKTLKNAEFSIWIFKEYLVWYIQPVIFYQKLQINFFVIFLIFQ